MNDKKLMVELTTPSKAVRFSVRLVALSALLSFMISALSLLTFASGSFAPELYCKLIYSISDDRYEFCEEALIEIRD